MINIIGKYFFIYVFSIYPLMIALQLENEHYTTSSWNCLLKCGKPMDNIIENSNISCHDKSYIWSLSNIKTNKFLENLEKKAFQQCSYFFDNIQEKYYQEAKSFCFEQGCHAPISKEIIPPQIDIKYFQKFNDYSFVQKDLMKTNEIKTIKNKKKKNKTQGYLNDININDILDEFDENLKVFKERVCLKKDENNEIFEKMKKNNEKFMENLKLVEKKNLLMEVFSYFVHKRLIETKTMISNLTEQEINALNVKFQEVLQLLFHEKSECI